MTNSRPRDRHGKLVQQVENIRDVATFGGAQVISQLGWTAAKSPIELEVHWYCESKDSQKDDRPIGAASVGQTWGFGDSYEWKLRVSSL